MIIWITGLSGVGKTTLAREVVKKLKETSIPVVHLDGDQVRSVIQDETTGYDRASRLTNAYRICRLAQMLEAQDLLVVVSTMSLFHEVHQWNREHFSAYFEVYLTADLSALAACSPEGLYNTVAEGSNIVGIDIPLEAPLSPDILIDNGSHEMAVEDIAQQILSALKAHPSLL